MRTRNHILDQHKFAPGILSRSGYFFLDDSTTPVLDDDDFPVERNMPGTRDWYFFCYNCDYAQACGHFEAQPKRYPSVRAMIEGDMGIIRHF